jgi:UDP-N-acetylglucosamine diphosphorylase/glucosamine-1-phosphate N-acetyltransferase
MRNMKLGIFEDAGYRNLLPLTWLRPAFDLRCGAERLIEGQLRSARAQAADRLWLRRDLAPLYAGSGAASGASGGADSWLLVNGRAMFERQLPALPLNHCIRAGGTLVAAYVPADYVPAEGEFFLDTAAVDAWSDGLTAIPAPEGVVLIERPWDLIRHNGAALRRQLTHGGVFAGKRCVGVHLLNASAIFVGEGAVLKPGVVLDAEHGPIHIAEGALIEPNAVVQGPAYIGPKSIIRPNAAIREETAIGPTCRVGGEVAESIFWGYGNKQHDGFVGHSYLGAWTNLGAGTTTSDLKNNYGKVRAAPLGEAIDTGMMLLGSIVGDHSKTGIGTLLPTGCVVGAASNIFLSGPAPKSVPSLAWLTDAVRERYRTDRAKELARIVMDRRGVKMTDAEDALFDRLAAQCFAVEAASWNALAAGAGGD